jgi:endonuclease IV
MLGFHVSKTSKIDGKPSKSLEAAIKYEVETFNINAIQIFTAGPRNLNMNKVNYTAVKNYCEEQKVNISIHGSYLSIGVWKSPNSKYIGHIVDMLESAKKIGAWGFVLHLPKDYPEKILEVLEIIANSDEFNSIRDENIPYLILEMPASKPDNKTYETPEKLNHLCYLLERSKKLNALKWCLCIDTAHQYSCGVDFDTQWNNWINTLSDFTKDKIHLIHLNGISPEHFKTGKDIHKIIMSPEDGIWGILLEDTTKFIENNKEKIINEGIWHQLSKSEQNKIHISSLASLVTFAKHRHIPLIMEINKEDLLYAKIALDITKHLFE